MTAVRLSPLQRQVLDQLAHMRVRPEDAWLTSFRIWQLTDVRTRAPLLALERRGMIERDSGTVATLETRWRITDEGREALG